MTKELKNMNRKIILSFLLSGLILLNSCQKDVDLFTPNGNPIGADTNWISTISASSPIFELKHSLNKEAIIDSIDCTTGGTILTRDGLAIILTPSSLVLPNGTPATGKVFVETMLIRQKGDMIRMDKPTTSNNRILVSGGEVYIRIRKETEDLHLAPNKRIYVRYADPAPSTAMRLFYGDESIPDRFNWIPNFDSSSIGFGTPNLPAYEFSTSNLHWINCDHFYDSTGLRTTVIASLPIDYTNANTAVYLVFHDINSLMTMYGDVASKRFMSAKVPAGKQVIVVSITKKGNNSYYLGHQSITTALTGSVGSQVVPLSPQPTSSADIKAYLATL